MIKYDFIGLRIAKAYQILALSFSFLFIALNLLLGVTIYIMLFFLLIAVLINGYFYLFANVKYNAQEFVIEKFLWKRILPADQFIKVEKLFFNFYAIRFVNHRYYFRGDIKSIFLRSEYMTNDILKVIEQFRSHCR